MSTTIQAEHFSKALYFLLDETFDTVHGIFLDPGTSLFETLAALSAEDVSIPVGGQCATLAAQVKHVAFYLDVLERGARTGVQEPVDWDAVWRTTASVTPAPLAPEVACTYVEFSALLANAESPNVVEFTRYGTCPFVLLIVVTPAIVTVTVCPALVKLPFGNTNVCVPGTFGDPSTSLTRTPFPVG